jgi:subtilisin family serine protease
MLVILLHPASAAVMEHGPIPSSENTQSETPQEMEYPSISITDTWIDSGIQERVVLGDEEVRVTVITKSLQALSDWQQENSALEKQLPPGPGESLIHLEPIDGVVDHRTFWVDSELVHKIPGIPGVIAVIDAQRAPEPYDTIPFEKPPGLSPESVRTGEIHGANDAWERGYTGDGMVVAVADTGVDFAHPDLNGTQARVTYDKSPYEGWPLMLDHNSMYHWMVYGEAYPARSTWYADTSTIDIDNNSDGLLEDSGYNVTGVNESLSGLYHLGQHPDSYLRSKQGGDVPILVVDDRISGLYETVYADIDRDGDFGDEVPMRPGEETAGLDTDGDGLWDVSAGLVYWVSDGSLGVPYGSTYAARHGYSDRVAGAGNLTLFMFESGSHGTLCASAIAAQGVVSDGKVLGMAPNATITSIGNHYSGGHSLDAWRFIAEGYDGNIDTPDQPHIGSFSFGYSSVDDAGADGYSLYLDWLTRIYNNNTSYAVAIGNGGHGFGTAKSPGASNGVFSVGAFSSRSSDSWGQNAPWSNRGPNVLGRMDPDIVSVGWSATGDIPLNQRNDANSAWGTWGGTSLATPIAAGLMALVAQAWQENLGGHPGSQEFRDFVLSTSDDRGYEPFVQGGGWFNASRAISTLEGDNGTWWASPAQWNSGTFQGEHREANLNLMRPGDSQLVEIEFTNYADSDVHLRYTPIRFSPLAHDVVVWNSTGNGSDEGDENGSWDGHQGDRPDLLIPLHIESDPNLHLPHGTRQLRARATIDYSNFDGNQDRSSEERVFLQIYRWTDEDGDGTYVEDFDNDSTVDSDDWTESDELEEVTNWWSNGPNAEVRVGNPFEDSRDGLLLGVWNYNGQLSDEEVRIEIDWTSFGSEEEDWISIPSTRNVPSNSTSVVPMTITVPLDADSGLHQHGVLVETHFVNQTTGQIYPSHRNWTLPIVTNVPWVGPFTLEAAPLDGNVSNQTLYTEEWISGATRWNWRSESGDWRFLSVEWPPEWDTGGTAVLDVDWEDNQYTDVDVLWMSEMAHGYAEEDPGPYGNSTFFIDERSTNNHVSSGSHNWGTFTGTSREVFAVPVSPGVHQMALHTALHGVNSNDNALNISVGYIAAEESGFERVVTDWSEGSGVDAVHVVSTIPLPVSNISAYGWSQPIYMANETASQDVSSNKMTASWWHNLTVQNASEISIEMNAHGDADLDLFLFRDSNEDGEFSSGEEVSRSWSASSSESIDIINPEDGQYAVAVHGYSVPSGTVQFWIDVDVVGGDDLRITDQMGLSDSEIASIWPTGSETLAGEIPHSAIQVNLEFDRPESAGTWSGFIDIELEGGISLRLPYAYELVELEPEVSFSVPINMTQTNETVPIEIHALDTGIGFRLDDLNWYGVNNDTSIPPADLVEAIETTGAHHNLTMLWNSGNHFAIPENVTFREVWINSTLPEIEQWHDYAVNLTDISGFFDEAFLSVAFDETAPNLAVSHIPWITSNEILTYQIQTEPGASAYHSGGPIVIDELGNAEVSFQLSQAEVGYDPSTGNPYYYIGGSSIFDITVSDAAGNAVSRHYEVIFDPELPSNPSLHSLVDQDGRVYSPSEITTPVNLTHGTLSMSVPSDVRSWCMTVLSDVSEHSAQDCGEVQMIPDVYNPSTGHPDPPSQGGSQDYSPTSYSFSTEGLPDGSYTIILELYDWANNTALESWPMSIDNTVPVVEWTLSPSDSNTSFFDHRQGLSWSSSEYVHLTFTIDGLLISERNSTTGGAIFDLHRTGIHEVCIIAVDGTEPHDNDNRFVDCRDMTLDDSIYDSVVIANWNGGLVSSDSVQATIQRGPDQEIWWNLAGSSEMNLIAPGMDVVTIDFELIEGDNQFKISIESLHEVDSYSLSVVRDTTAPDLTMWEVTNRTSNLETERVVSGTCERGSNVMIWSDVDSHQFVCPVSEEFNVLIEVLNSAGEHQISALSTDSANNEMRMSITVLNQVWSDWAIEDARAGGPMMWWFSLGFVGLLAAVLIPSVTLARRRSRSRRMLKHGPDLDEIMAEIEAAADHQIAQMEEE